VPTARLHSFLEAVRQEAALQQTRGLPDAELLERFVRRQDTAAFAALVERHGPMVLGVCRRLLRRAEDAEDASQAVFLVLARKAGSVRKREALGSWLHGVACRVARKARAAALRRGQREAPGVETAAADPAGDITWREALTILDEELNRLPAGQRGPLVLFYLEGKTQEEAARELGLSLGALRGRLERGRERLRARLLRRGVGLPAALLGAALTAAGASAAAAPPFVTATSRAAALVAAGRAARGVATAKAVTLMEGVTAAMRMTRLGKGVLILAAFLGLAAGAATLYPARPGAPAASAQAPAPAPRLGKPVWQQRLTIGGHQGWATYLEFSPDGKALVTFDPAASDLTFWDTATWNATAVHPLKQVFGGDGSYNMPVFAPDGKAAVARGEKVGKDGRRARAVALFEAPGGKLRAVLPGELPTFSPDGKLLATGGDGVVTIYDVRTAKELRALRLPGDWSKGMSCWHLWFSPDGHTLVTSRAGVVKLWDTATGRERATFSGYLPTINPWTSPFSPDGRTLITAKDSTLRLWDVATGRERGRRAGGPKADSARLERLIADLDSASFATREEATRELERLGEAAEAALQAALRGQPSPEVRKRAGALLGKLAGPGLTGHRLPYVYAVFSPDSKLVATMGTWYGGAAGASPLKNLPREVGEKRPLEVKLWDVETGRPRPGPRGEMFFENQACFSPDGKALAYLRAAPGEHARCVGLWDLAANKERAVIPCDNLGTFSPDGKLLLAAHNADLTFWDAATGKRVASLPGAPGRQVVFQSLSPDWRLLVTAAMSKANPDQAEAEITVWELSDRPVKKEARGKPKAAKQ
jgi:RNA polymerase sigma factor (sigma-70 family)